MLLSNRETINLKINSRNSDRDHNRQQQKVHMLKEFKINNLSQEN